MEYNVEQKRHWRYWVWKRIAENCRVHPRFATVLFLAGPSPLDLEAAKKYGFRLENIVAVDMDEKCVREARNNGCTAIQGTLHEVATKWSDGVIHGIVADYCCGLTSLAAIQTCQLISLANVVAANFQRGRETDEESRMVRECFSNVKRSAQLGAWYELINRAERDAVAGGRKTYESFWAAFISPATEVSRKEDPEYNKAILSLRKATIKYLISSLMGEQLKIENGSCLLHETSYRSNKVVMDTAVCVSERWRLPNTGDQVSSRNEVDRRISAMKAVRTMNGAVRFAAANN